MIKSLTEKWKNGKLDYGYYYLQTKDGERRIDRTTCDIGSLVYLWTQTDKDYIQKVLAPVPTFDEVKEMSQKIGRLELDNEALEMAHNEGNEINAELEAENKKLKERLADADKAIKLMDEKYGEHYTIADGTKMGNSPAWKYMLKWGVK